MLMTQKDSWWEFALSLCERERNENGKKQKWEARKSARKVSTIFHVLVGAKVVGKEIIRGCADERYEMNADDDKKVK
jgi:hypothetical protein